MKLAKNGRGLRIAGFISLILALLCLVVFFMVLLLNLEIRLKAVYLTILIISSKVTFWLGVFLIGRDYYYRNRERIRAWFRRWLD
jgi:hypothetical protein